MFLGCLGVDRRCDGEGPLTTARRRMGGRLRDLGPPIAERHGILAQRTADLAEGRRTAHALIAVMVRCAGPAQLVVSKLSGACIVGLCRVAVGPRANGASSNKGRGVAGQ